MTTYAKLISETQIRRDAPRVATIDTRHVAALRARCDEWELEGREILDKYSDRTLALIYNGLGPDSFPAWLRAVVTALSPDLEPDALIHDVEWHEADGTRAGFDASNARFRRNGYKSAKARFGWADPRRYLLMNRARRFANYCQLFGWKAWSTPSTPVAEDVR